MLAWYCCIEDVNNILEKVKICKTNFGGLLLFNLFFHFLLMQLLLKQRPSGSCFKSKLFTVENLKACK